MTRFEPCLGNFGQFWPKLIIIFNDVIFTLTDINKLEVPSHFQGAYHEACKRAKVNPDAKFEKNNLKMVKMTKNWINLEIGQFQCAKKGLKHSQNTKSIELQLIWT